MTTCAHCHYSYYDRKLKIYRCPDCLGRSDQPTWTDLVRPKRIRRRNVDVPGQLQIMLIESP